MGQWSKQGFLEQHTRTILSTENSTVRTQERIHSSPWWWCSYGPSRYGHMVSR